MLIQEFRDVGDWVAAALADFEAAAAELRAAGRSTLSLCLAGGTTPRPVYAALASSCEAACAVRGLSVELWLGDERAVPLCDPARNAHLVEETLVRAAWDPRPRFFPWPSGAAASAAIAYAAELARRLGPRPSFDLCFLGLGADGHTASLFPGEELLAEAVRLAGPARAPTPPHERMSLSFPALLGARRIRFLVRGVDKEAVVHALAAADPRLPASRLAAVQDSAILYCRM